MKTLSEHDRRWMEYKDYKYKIKKIGNHIVVELIGGTDRGGIIRVWSRFTDKDMILSTDEIVEYEGKKYSSIISGHFMYYENGLMEYRNIKRVKDIFEFSKQCV